MDPDDALSERCGTPPHARNILAMELRSQAELCVVRKRDRFRFSLEAKQWRDRTKCFFPGNRHRRRDVGQNRGLEESSAERVSLAAYQNFCAFILRVLDV